MICDGLMGQLVQSSFTWLSRLLVLGIDQVCLLLRVLVFQR